MWKEDLIPQLCWSNHNEFEEPRSDNETSIPSWSWAALDTGIYVPLLDSSEEDCLLVSILEAMAFPIEDCFGDVSGGTIRMRCRLPITIVIVQLEGPNHLQMSYIRSGASLLPKPVWLCGDREGYIRGQELYLLPLFCGRNRHYDPDRRVIHGLIIEPAGHSFYRRIGSFETKKEDNGQDILGAQKEASYEDRYFVGEPLGLDEEGQKMCIITLV